MEKIEFGFSIGIFDILTKKIRQSIEEEAKKYSCYALGIYTDDFIENELKTDCLKNLEDRMQIANQIEGVSFTFPIDGREVTQITKLVQEQYMKYLDAKEEEQNQKYDVGFVIGTYDLFHAGHLENILLAKKQSKKLAAVIKTDERVLKNKNKMPVQNTAERAKVIAALKPIDHVFFMDIDSTRADVINEVCEYYGVNREDIAMFLGSDLKEKESKHKDELEGINLIFTDRDEDKMKVVSSSYYQEQYKKQNRKDKDDDDDFIR